MYLNNPVLVKLTSTLLKTGHFIQQSKIGDMPHWTDEQKNAVIQERNATPVPNEIDEMNYKEGVAFNTIKDHFLDSNVTTNQLFMIITGLGGSGKGFQYKQ